MPVHQTDERERDEQRAVIDQSVHQRRNGHRDVGRGDPDVPRMAVWSTTRFEAERAHAGRHAGRSQRGHVEQKQAVRVRVGVLRVRHGEAPDRERERRDRHAGHRDHEHPAGATMQAATFACNERNDHRRQGDHTGDDVWRE